MNRSELAFIWNAFRQRNGLSLLIFLNMAMFLSFACWQVTINNFAHDVAGFDGAQWGALQSVREVPGFLAFLVVFIIIWVREQVLAYIALVLLAIGVIMTGFLPSFWGLILATLISSIGFHYFETVNQSLQLQWLPKSDAPHQMALIMSAGSLMVFLVYAFIAFLWKPLGLSYELVYMCAGLGSLAMIAWAIWRYPIFPETERQARKIVLKKRYLLYYILQFFSGARRQIFVVFAGFLMVEMFGFSVSAMAALALITHFISVFVAPWIGKMIIRIGERQTLIIEYSGLVMVFAAYAMVIVIEGPAWFAAILYVIDHIFFAMRIALKTYFQKIGDPEDMASTAAVSFTINHIAAVFLPIGLGVVWMISPLWVFVFAVILALASLFAALFVPRHPAPGHEWRQAKA